MMEQYSSEASDSVPDGREYLLNEDAPIDMPKQKASAPEVNVADVARWLGLLIKPDDVTELRALKVSHRNYVRDHTEAGMLSQGASRPPRRCSEIVGALHHLQRVNRGGFTRGHDEINPPRLEGNDLHRICDYYTHTRLTACGFVARVHTHPPHPRVAL